MSNLDGHAIADALLRLEPVSPAILQARDARRQDEERLLQLRDAEDQRGDQFGGVDVPTASVDEGASESHAVKHGPELPAQVVVDPVHVVSHDATVAALHLPECPFGGDTDYQWLDDCICDNLRACERRARGSALDDSMRALATATICTCGGHPHEDDCCWLIAASAIDALRHTT